MLDKIPIQIDSAHLICYIILDNRHIRTGNTKHLINGQIIQEIYGLAICNYDNDSGYYLFYCDEDWETITDTYHDTIESAQRQAEFEFSNTINSWSTRV